VVKVGELQTKIKNKIIKASGENIQFYNTTFGGFPAFVLAYARYDMATGNRNYLVILNIGKSDEHFALHKSFTDIHVVLVSGGVTKYNVDDQLDVGVDIYLKPGDGIVLFVKNILT
jgi:hypothetical protein